MGQGVRTSLGHGAITCVLQTQFSSFLSDANINPTKTSLYDLTKHVAEYFLLKDSTHCLVIQLKGIHLLTYKHRNSQIHSDAIRDFFFTFKLTARNKIEGITLSCMFRNIE